MCDWYLEEAEAGRILGRNRRPIKASTLKMDRSRIETHIKPLLGARLVSGLTLRDIEGMQATSPQANRHQAGKQGEVASRPAVPGLRAARSERCEVSLATQLG